jgi:hypothetical protein
MAIYYEIVGVCHSLQGAMGDGWVRKADIIFSLLLYAFGSRFGVLREQLRFEWKK